MYKGTCLCRPLSIRTELFPFSGFFLFFFPSFSLILNLVFFFLSFNYLLIWDLKPCLFPSPVGNLRHKGSLPAVITGARLHPEDGIHQNPRTFKQKGDNLSHLSFFLKPFLSNKSEKNNYFHPKRLLQQQHHLPCLHYTFSQRNKYRLKQLRFLDYCAFLFVSLFHDFFFRGMCMNFNEILLNTKDSSRSRSIRTFVSLDLEGRNRGPRLFGVCSRHL